jgi:hypothetical protein
MKYGMICSSCGNECEEVGRDNGFYYQAGSISGYHEDVEYGSDCCGEEVLDGKVYLDKSSVHTAKKNHFQNGKIVVAEGKKYRKNIMKSFGVDGDGKRTGFIKISKRAM